MAIGTVMNWHHIDKLPNYQASDCALNRINVYEKLE
jgi:hypothetical protein